MCCRMDLWELCIPLLTVTQYSAVDAVIGTLLFQQYESNEGNYLYAVN